MIYDGDFESNLSILNDNWGHKASIAHRFKAWWIAIYKGIQKPLGHGIGTSALLFSQKADEFDNNSNSQLIQLLKKYHLLIP